MTRAARLSALRPVSGLLRDRALADLAAAQAAQQAARAALAAHDAVRPGALRTDSHPCMQERHAEWWQARRRDLNAALARATANHEAVRRRAAQAVGRDDALARLVARQR